MKTLKGQNEERDRVLCELLWEHISDDDTPNEKVQNKMSDKDIYPTDEELRTIKNWSMKSIKDYHNLMNYIYQLWYNNDYAWHQIDNIYKISTMDWCGNQDIIYAMKQNKIFWLFFWYQSTRGGHYMFCPVGEDIEK